MKLIVQVKSVCVLSQFMFSLSFFTSQAAAHLIILSEVILFMFRVNVDLSVDMSRTACIASSRIPTFCIK